MKEILQTSMTMIYYFSLFAIYVLGIYHSYDKHDDETYLILSPFALYRGVEIFFHSNLKDWESELPNVVYFLHNMNYDNPPDFNKDFSEFKKRINDFSDEGINYLNLFATDLLNYRIGWLDDFEASVNNLNWGEKYNFVISEKTKKFRNKLNDYELEEHFNLEDKSMIELSNYINENLDKTDYERLENIKLDVHLSIKTQKEVYNFAYKRIFN